VRAASGDGLLEPRDERMREMSKLIEALQILLKYGDPAYPTHCEHDVLTIVGIEPSKVSKDDKSRLKELGFFVGEDDCFQSFRFGSA
jgi:hypothetical protein